MSMKITHNRLKKIFFYWGPHYTDILLFSKTLKSNAIEIKFFEHSKMLPSTFEDLESYCDQKRHYTCEEKCNHKDRNYAEVKTVLTWLQTRR